MSRRRSTHQRGRKREGTGGESGHKSTSRSKPGNGSELKLVERQEPSTTKFSLKDYQVGSRAKSEVETLGTSALADIHGVGPKTTKKLAKHGYKTLQDAERLEDPTVRRQLIQKTKLSERVVQKIINHARHERLIHAEIALKEKKTRLEKERKAALKAQKQIFKGLTKKKKTKEAKANTMRHQLKEYLVRSAKENEIVAPDDLWDDYSSEIQWNETTVSEAWDLLYEFLQDRGLEQEKHYMERIKKKAELAKESQREATIDHFERELEALEEQQDQIFEDLKRLGEEDPELAQEIIKMGES